MRRLGDPIPLGRLGNQLHSAAAVIACSLRHNMVPLIPERWEYLRWLSVPPEWVGTPQPGDIELADWPELAHLPVDARPYAQDVGLLAGFEDQVRAAFRPSAEALTLLTDRRFDWYGRMCDEGEVVAMSVRRGDIVDLPEYQPVLTLDYYRNALALFPDAPVVAFSDDPAWVQTTLAPQLDRSIRVLSGAPARPHGPAYCGAPASDWVDLQLQAMAPHHCCANSTFSWWGAFLSDDPSPVYPSVWHGNLRSHINVSLMFPPSWRRVSVEPLSVDSARVET